MMNILGIDSSGLVASVALQSDDKLVGEYTIHNKKTHSQTLLPMIHDMLEMADVSVKELDAIAIASGPGSFTGLRIGAATAKGLGGALSIPLIAVPTLEGLAYNLAGAEALVCPIMDARRQQAYYGIYDVSKEVPVEIEKPDAAPIEVVLQKAKETKREVIFLGDGVPVFQEKIKQCEGLLYRFCADSVRYQRASSVTALGKKYYEQGRQMKAAEFAPMYLRLSQAERERMEKENITPHDMSEMLNKKSGMLGISGVSSDDRDVTKAAREGNPRAILAHEMLEYEITKFIGAYAAALNGCDVIVFTAGLGENQAHHRQVIGDGLTYLGVKIDPQLNEEMIRGKEGLISTPDSKVKVYVIPTNEELVIARDTKEIVEAL